MNAKISDSDLLHSARNCCEVGPNSQPLTYYSTQTGEGAGKAELHASTIMDHALKNIWSSLLRDAKHCSVDCGGELAFGWEYFNVLGIDWSR